MSAAELRARIVKLDMEIELQKSLLAKLEHDKKLLNRQLNVLVDPVARLPLEISSEIFLQCLRDPFPKPGAREAPMLLLDICSNWTAIALSTPALWMAVQIDFPCSARLAQVLPIWFERAHNRPLSVSLHGDLDPRVFAIIWQYGRQLKHLAISCTTHIFPDDQPDLFGDIARVPLPLLTTLSVHGSSDGREISGDHLIQLLGRAPNIVECNLNNVAIYGTSEKVVLPTLRRLRFEDSDDKLLDCLSLPVLETLSVPMLEVSLPDLISFLKRSAPPLQELTLGWAYHATPFSPLHECLHLIPRLTQFVMWLPDSQVVAELFAALAESHSLLPHLSRLSIDMSGNWDGSKCDIPESAWRALLRALSTRRNRFRIRLLGPDITAPPRDVVAAFRELVVEGVQIYIGATEKCNFIDT
ncbi:hypothetical protein K438DRAFT_1987022 [Mycena galopus ATCC 62051]|nr:hypothetical protein K438DRAFT_1987022 [Mycena galopus ATCC 62051]